MKIGRNRLFFDIEKENQWLNQMAAQGYRLARKVWLTYEFEPCEPNAYVYQVEKLHSFDTKKDEAYIDFLQEMDIHLVTKQLGFYYFEKENDGTPFELYTDAQSKIKYYGRMLPVLALVALFNINIITDHWTNPNGPWILNISVSYTSNIIMLAAVIVTTIKYAKRISILKKQLVPKES